MPDVHNFPLTSHSAMETLQVTVYHLPRLTSAPFVSSNCKLIAEGISKHHSDSSIDRCALESKELLRTSSSMQYLRNNSRTITECPKMKISPKSSSSSYGHCSNGKSIVGSVSNGGAVHCCSQEFCFDASCLSTVKSPTHNVHLLNTNSCGTSRLCEAPETVTSLTSGNLERTSILKRISAKTLESSGRSKEACGKGRVCPPEASSPVRFHSFVFPAISNNFVQIPFNSRAKVPDSTVDDINQQ